MSKPNETWTVHPHGKLVQLDDNLFTVTGELKMPLAKLERRMTVARLERGELVLYSAIALDEPEMQQLEALGRPRYLVVPDALHRLDAKPYKDRYPDLIVIAPKGGLEKVQEVVPVDATVIDFGDPRVHFFALPGTDEGDSALLVESLGGTTLVLNDLIFNYENRSGLRGWLLETLGITGDAPHIPGFIKMRGVKDRDRLVAQLQDWSHLPALKRIVVSHGRIIDHDAARILDRVSRELAA